MLSTSLRIVSSERFLTSQIGRRAQETSDVLAPDRRQMLAEAHFIHRQEAVPMIAFLSRHALDHGRRVGVAILQVFRERHVYPAVLLLRGDGHPASTSRSVNSEKLFT